MGRAIGHWSGPVSGRGALRMLFWLTWQPCIISSSLTLLSSPEHLSLSLILLIILNNSFGSVINHDRNAMVALSRWTGFRQCLSNYNYMSQIKHFATPLQLGSAYTMPLSINTHTQGFIQDNIFASPKCFENVTKCVCALDCALGRTIKNVSIIYI